MRGGEIVSVRFRALLASRFWREPLLYSFFLHYPQHDAMLADNLYTNLHTRSTTEHRTSKRPRYIAYIQSIIRTRLYYTHFAPFRSSLKNTSLLLGNHLFLRVYLFFFLIPIYKFYSTLRELPSPLISAFSKMITSNAFITPFPVIFPSRCDHPACVSRRIS